MSIQTLSYHAFLVEMDWLFELVNTHVEKIGWKMASHQLAVPRLPRRVGADVVPFYLAGDIKAVFEYARGSKDVSEDYVEDTIKDVLRLIFGAPLLLDTFDEERAWDKLAARSLGTILLAARARARVDVGDWPTVRGVQALTGLSRSRLERTGVEIKTRGDRELCEPRAVAALLGRVDKDDDDNI